MATICAEGAIADAGRKRSPLRFALRRGGIQDDAMVDDDASNRYLHGHDDAVLRSHRQRTADNSASYLLARLAPDARVLDVGCGPGTITVGLASRVPAGEVIGIDASARVLDEAQSLAQTANCPNLHLEVGNVTALGFPDGSFDVVHAHQVLQHLPDPILALREMRRVCRPGGIVAVRDADYGSMCWYPASSSLDTWQALYQAVARSAGGEPDAGRHLRAWAVAAGFSRIEATASAWCFASDAERRWWGELWAERITRTRFAEQATATGLATVRELHTLAEAWRSWIDAEGASFIVPHGEVLCTP